VKMVLSPGLAISTISPRNITSIDLGIDPAGMSPECSCTLSFCQSTKIESEFISSHLVLLPQLSLTHLTGSVNLNYYSIFPLMLPQSLHL
jgi:hypothetical protein